MDGTFHAIICRHSPPWEHTCLQNPGARWTWERLCVQRPEVTAGCLFPSLSLYLWDIVSPCSWSWQIWLEQLARKPQISTCLCLPSSGVIGALLYRGFLCQFWKLKGRLLHFNGKCSVNWACMCFINESFTYVPLASALICELFILKVHILSFLWVINVSRHNINGK